MAGHSPEKYIFDPGAAPGRTEGSGVYEGEV
jgi:hypothetical protein